MIEQLYETACRLEEATCYHHGMQHPEDVLCTSSQPNKSVTYRPAGCYIPVTPYQTPDSGLPDLALHTSALLLIGYNSLIVLWICISLVFLL
jgi:hypothetical protein